jgi:hypothetical protein
VAASNFYCRLSQAKLEAVQRKKKAYARKKASDVRRDLTSKTWEDVTVKFSKGRGDNGRKISEADFRLWLDVAIDITGPHSADIVRTDHVDLILDKQFPGRIYLKGLRVPGLGLDGRVYIFGYNFVRGQINRDREPLVNRSEEAEMLAQIWDQSIVRRGDSVTDNHLKLFHDHQDCADVASAEEKVSLSAARKTEDCILMTLRAGGLKRSLIPLRFLCSCPCRPSW